MFRLRPIAICPVEHPDLCRRCRPMPATDRCGCRTRLNRLAKPADPNVGRSDYQSPRLPRALCGGIPESTSPGLASRTINATATPPRTSPTGLHNARLAVGGSPRVCLQPRVTCADAPADQFEFRPNSRVISTSFQWRSRAVITSGLAFNSQTSINENWKLLAYASRLFLSRLRSSLLPPCPVFA